MLKTVRKKLQKKILEVKNVWEKSLRLENVRQKFLEVKTTGKKLNEKKNQEENSLYLDKQEKWRLLNAGKKNGGIVKNLQKWAKSVKKFEEKPKHKSPFLCQIFTFFDDFYQNGRNVPQNPISRMAYVSFFVFSRSHFCYT